MVVNGANVSIAALQRGRLFSEEEVAAFNFPWSFLCGVS